MKAKEPFVQSPDLPLSPVLRLLITIIVKQHLLILDSNVLNQLLNNSDSNPEVIKIVRAFLGLNKELLNPAITGKLKDDQYKVGGLPWHRLEFLCVIRKYSDALLKLGFSLEEQRELFPTGTPLARVLSLKDQALLQIRKVMAKSVSFRTVLLGQDLNNLLNNKDYLFSTAKQHYINSCSNWMTSYQRYLAALNLDYRLESHKTISETYRVNSRAFVENSHIYEEPHQIVSQVSSIISFLLKMLVVPEENLLQHFEERSSFNLAHLAAAYAPTYILSEIMALSGFDLKVRAKKKQSTLLHLALENHNLLAFDYLMNRYRAHNPMLNEGDSKGSTALHCVVRVRDLTRVKTLVAQGAVVNQADSFGDTPLHWDAHSETLPYSSDGTEEPWNAIAGYLVASGARLEVFNNHGRMTPYEVYLRGSKDVVATKRFFESFYRQIRKREGFFYGKIILLEQVLATPNGPFKQRIGIEFLRAALRECRGIVFLQEFLMFDPETVRRYRDSENGNNVIHIILAAMTNRRHVTRYPIGILLLELLAKKCPELYFEKNLLSRSGFQLALDKFDQEYMDRFFKDDFFYKNASPLRIGSRLSEILFIISGLFSTSLILLITWGPKNAKLEPVTFGILFSSLVICALLILYIVTPPCWWQNLESRVVKILSKLSTAPNTILELICGNNLAYQVEESVLEEIVIPSFSSLNDSSIPQRETSIVYSSPIGVYGRIRQRMAIRNNGTNAQPDVHHVSTPSP
jgi:hypothetical protein